MFWGDDALLYRSARNGRLQLRHQAGGWVVGDLVQGQTRYGRIDVGSPGTADAAAVPSSASSALSNAWASFPWQEHDGGWAAVELLEEHGGFVGATLGNYVLRKPLGSGGSGVVFQAAHQILGREVAVKICYPIPGPRHSVVTATERAVRGLASLQHPGIIPLLDFGYLETPTTTSVYLVMDLVDGDPLDVWSERLGQDVTAEMTRKRLDVAIMIAEALQAAHRCSFVGSLGVAETGVLHGDVKPSNILVRRADARPVLIDFMIPDLQRLLGRARSGIERQNWTKSPDGHYQYRPKGLTEVFGTPGFMPPEQEIDGIVLPTSDIFALGQTFSHCLFPLRGYHSLPIYLLLEAMTRPQVADRPQTMASVVQQLRKLRRR